MKTILVPTDFSPTAEKAADYAVKLAGELGARKIVLYNAYQAIPPTITEPSAPVMPVIDVETLKEISETGLTNFSREIKNLCPEGIEVESMSEFAILADEINSVCEKTGADLIVMGVTGASRVEEVLLGSTATAVVRLTKIPVIVVPVEGRFSALKNIMLACDFKNVVETTPVLPIKNILNATGAKLHVVNINEKDREISDEKIQQQQLLYSLFKEYDPLVHIQHNHDFITAINYFVNSNHIDLIITIPKKHGFFESLFKESHTKKLAFHSHVPLMFIHEEDL